MNKLIYKLKFIFNYTTNTKMNNEITIENINSLYKKLYLNFVLGEELTNDETILLNKLLNSNEFYSKVYCVLFKQMIIPNKITNEYERLKKRADKIVYNSEENAEITKKFNSLIKSKNNDDNFIEENLNKKTNHSVNTAEQNIFDSEELNEKNINIINQCLGFKENDDKKFVYLKVKYNNNIYHTMRQFLFVMKIEKDENKNEKTNNNKIFIIGYEKSTGDDSTKSYIVNKYKKHSNKETIVKEPLIIEKWDNICGDAEDRYLYKYLTGLVNLEPLFHENQLTHFLKRLNE